MARLTNCKSPLAAPWNDRLVAAGLLRLWESPLSGGAEVGGGGGHDGQPGAQADTDDEAVRL